MSLLGFLRDKVFLGVEFADLKGTLPLLTLFPPEGTR